MITISVKEYLKVKWMACLPDELSEKLTHALFWDKKYIEVEEHLINQLHEDTNKRLELNKRLNNCAQRNNQGIEFEKQGEEANAIKIYEKNIADEYPATHSYERLMKIYRRLKEYDDELRVINIAIKVFSNENTRRFEKVKSDPKNLIYADDLQIAHETCTGFKNNEGWYIYSPYPLTTYIDRLTKCQNLKEKQASKTQPKGTK